MQFTKTCKGKFEYVVIPFQLRSRQTQGMIASICTSSELVDNQAFKFVFSNLILSVNGRNNLVVCNYINQSNKNF